MSEFFLALFVRSINALVGLFGLFLVSRHFGAGGKGLITEALLPATTLLMIFKLGIDYASVMVIKRYKGHEEDLLGGFVTTTVLIALAIVFLQTSYSDPLWRLVAPLYAKEYVPNVQLALWLFPTQLFHDACLNAMLGRYGFRVFTVIKLIQPVLFAGLLVTFWCVEKFVSSGSFQLSDVLISYSVSYGISGLVMFVMLLRVLPLKFGRALICVKQLVLVGGAFQGVALLIYFNRRLDVWMITWVLDAEDNGVYSVVVSFLEVAWFASKPLSSLVLLRTAADEDRTEIGKILRFSLVFSLLYLGCLTLAAPWLLSLAGSGFLEPGFAPLLMLMPGVFLLNIHQILSQVMYGVGEGGKLLPLMLVALIVNFILNLIWIVDYQLVGVAVASSVSYSIISLGVLKMVMSRMKFGFKDLFIPRWSDFSDLFKNVRR